MSAVFKEITVETFGQMLTVEQFFEICKKRNMHVGKWARDMISTFKEKDIPLSHNSVPLCLVNGQGLGFPSSLPYRDLVARALQKKLKLCEPYLALYLRILIEDQQPPGTSFMTAMNPILDSDGVLGMFNLVRDRSGAFQLHGNRGEQDFVWDNKDYTFCFRRM